MIYVQLTYVSSCYEGFNALCCITACKVKAVALSTSLCAMFQVNLLPQELLMEYCDSMSRLPLSQQVSGQSCIELVFVIAATA